MLVRRGPGLLLLAAALLPRPAEAAVDDYLGKPIASVRLLIEGRETTDPVLTHVVETTAGQPLSMVQVRESVTHLFSFARFEDVRVDAVLEAGRVVLSYELSPIHPVTRIRFAGVEQRPGIDAGALRRAIVDRYGATPPLGRLADMTRMLADLLRERGYLNASLSPRADLAHDPDRATLVFSIDPGPRTIIGDVALAGGGAPGRDLVKRLGLTPGAPYQREALNTRIQKYVDDRRADGYYEAKVVPEVKLADGARVADVTLTVAPGPRVRVVFEGDPLPGDRRDELVPVRREGSADEDLLEDSSNRIEEYWRAQGYRDAAAPHTRSESGGELVITFAVNRGRQYRVVRYDVAGAESLTAVELEPMLRLHEGQPFSAARLDADAAAIEDLYHRRGFASARATPDVLIGEASPGLPTVPVTIRLAVSEGARTNVDEVMFSGNQAIDAAALAAKTSLHVGSPYVPVQLAADRDAILLAYQDLGYESASVEALPLFSADQTRVVIRFVIREGPRIFVDHVLIVGNVRTATETIERELRVKPGSPLSVGAIDESQRRLAGLGLFRRARITEVRHGDETTRDVLVTVEEAPATTVGVGGGLEGRLIPSTETNANGTVGDELDLAPRVFFEVGRRNLFGRNRSVNLFASVSLHSTHSTAAGVTEYRFVGTFREPRLFNTAADAFVNVTVEQQIRSSFNFRRKTASAVVARHLTQTLSATANYQIQRTNVFDSRVAAADVPLIDRTFTQFLLSSFSGSVVRDTRNDQVDPASGDYVSANAQVAAKAIGSEVGFVKTFVTAQAFRTLPTARRIVAAGNARIGMAGGFSGFGQLPASERFFAGGDTTVRGFAVDRLGIRHVPFQPGDTLDSEGLPIGGNGLVVFNAELRAAVFGGSQLVGFYDTGQVFARASDIDLGALRSAVGGGIRYKSPFGPIRFDLGFKVHRLPGEGLTAWFVSFGQAF